MLKSIVLNNNVRSRTHWLSVPRDDHQTAPNPQRVSQFEVKHLAAWCFVMLDTSYVVASTSLQLGTDTNKLTKKKKKNIFITKCCIRSLCALDFYYYFSIVWILLHYQKLSFYSNGHEQ